MEYLPSHRAEVKPPAEAAAAVRHVAYGKMGDGEPGRRKGGTGRHRFAEERKVVAIEDAAGNGAAHVRKQKFQKEK